MKNVILSFIFLFSFLGFLHAQKPISQMVSAAKSKGLTPYQTTLFSSSSESLNQRPDLSTSVASALLVDWDAPTVQKLRTTEPEFATLNVPTANGIVTVELVPAKGLSDGFVVNRGSDGAVVNGLDLGNHYWGIVKDDPNSLVAISVYDNEIMGTITTDFNQYVIGAIPNQKNLQHIIYEPKDLKGTSGFTCFTDDIEHYVGSDKEPAAADRAGADNCVRMYVETDYTIFQNKGSVANVVSYMTGVFSQVSALYTNETVNVVLHNLLVWDVADPYTGPTASNYLTQFRTALNGTFNGDLAHLVGINGLGGVAYLDVLCNGVYSCGYSSINSTYSNVPTYSWTIEVLTHEIGHNLGSPHTHACAWNGNNTAIDGCGPTAGYSEGCTAPNPTNGGTIMSYCHLVSGVGINFNNGFGPQPGDRIRTEVYNAPCLAPCGGGGGGCTYGAINSNGFDASWGIWSDGGTDCARINNATYANSPTYSIQLRDNTSSSVMTTLNQNWSAYDELTVTFSYITVSFETGEDFWLQYSTNNGSTYTTIGDYNAGTQFTNGVRGSGSVVIPGPFTANTRLRFRADASADDDQVYIDDVVITGCLQNAAQGGTGERHEFAQTNGDATLPTITDVQASPNPADAYYQIVFNAEKAMDVTIMVSDLSGRIAMVQNLNAAEGQNNTSLDVASLSEGVYFVQIKAGDATFVQKMMIARR